MINNKVLIKTIVFTVFFAGFLYLVLSKWPSISSGIAKVSILSLVFLSLLQGLSYFFRVWAWKLSLKETGAIIPEPILQSSSGATFLLNCFVPIYIGQALRMFVLKKSLEKPPKVSQMATAEGVNIFVEALIAGAIVIALIPFLPFGIWPALLVGGVIVAVFFSVRYLALKKPDSDWVRATDIFKNRKDLTIFTSLLAVVILVQPVRFYLVLSAIGNPKSIIDSFFSFISTSIGGILPIGPAASATGGVSAATGETLAVALTVSLVLAGSAAIAAGLYLLVAGMIHFYSAKLATIRN